MTSPRKFAEKIALHKQKQAEETAHFEQIMRDVHNVHKAKPPGGAPVALSPAPSPAPPHSPAHSPEEEGCGGGGGRGRSAGVGPMRSRPVDKQRLDTSPYGTPMGSLGPMGPGSYLSPPEPLWRRTHSDSALHQTVNDHHHHHLTTLGSLSPTAARRAENQHASSEQRNRRHLSSSPDGRPRSSTTSQPRVTTNNIYQLQQEMPTGSLPDLTQITNINFPPPLPTPLDQDDSNSPYGTSPRHNSSTMLSPSEQLQGVDRFCYSPHTSRGPSPEPGLHSPHSPQSHSPHSPHSLQSPLGPHSPNSLTVPGHFRFLHACKGGVVQDNGLDLQSHQEQSNQYIYHHQEDPNIATLVNVSSPISINTSSLQHSAHEVSSLNSYRNPQCISRPSPQSSPSLSIPYRCSSPHSAPQSPISMSSSPSYLPESGFFSQAQAALQQDLEQFSMSDDPLTHVPDPGYFSTSPAQLHYSQNHSHHNNICDLRSAQPQTPNTPTIPDIILTEADDLAKELGSAINVGSLDLEDVFPVESLSRLDDEALDMLTNPNVNVVTDAATEAHFRMESDNM